MAGVSSTRGFIYNVTENGSEGLRKIQPFKIFSQALLLMNVYN